MPLWARVIYEGHECFGTVAADAIAVHTGDMFVNPQPTGRSISRGAAKLLTPTRPGKMIGLVDNYRALVAKLDHPVPIEPLYFLKGTTSFLAPVTSHSYAAVLRRQGGVRRRARYRHRQAMSRGQPRPTRTAISSATRASMTSPPPRFSTRLPASPNGHVRKTLTRSVFLAR